MPAQGLIMLGAMFPTDGHQVTALVHYWDNFGTQQEEDDPPRGHKITLKDQKWIDNFSNWEGAAEKSRCTRENPPTGRRNVISQNCNQSRAKWPKNGKTQVPWTGSGASVLLVDTEAAPV